MEKCSREKLVDKIVKEYNLTEEDAHTGKMSREAAAECTGMVGKSHTDRYLYWEIFSADDSGDLGQQRFLKCVGGDDRISGGRD